MCTVCWIKNAQSLSLFIISSYSSIMNKNNIVFDIWHRVLCKLIRYHKPQLFADIWPTYSCIQRNSAYFRLGEKENYLPYRHRTYHACITTLYLALAVKKLRQGGLCFSFRDWERRGRKTGIKVRETVIRSSPKSTH
jgi:hypothetical protein